MPRLDLLHEAERQITICNACRYCEGFCAVFPAMELRTSFKHGDLVYLSNLCHDCRACFYACQYAPPHAFDVNIPHILAELRSDTYADYSWPRMLSRLGAASPATTQSASSAQPRASSSAAPQSPWLFRVGSSLALTSALVLLLAAVIVALVLTFQGGNPLTTPQTGEGSFYRVVPYAAMVIPALAMLLYAAGVFWRGVAGFWRDTRADLKDLVQPSAMAVATRDAFGLRYLRGGGDGCNYPDEHFSQTRRWLHHLTYYGFLLDLASTIVAAIYDHVFGWIAPYPVLSLPVVLGTSGGIMLMLGTGGLLWLKLRSDRAPAASSILRMDVAFLALLFMTALTGMLLLVLRDTAWMGALLTIHLAVVAGLFLSLPYGKFAHAIYRYAALVRNAMEQSSARART